MAHKVDLVLGTAQLAQPYGIVSQPVISSLDRQIEIVRAAERGGVRAIDTSPIYGAAEKVIGNSKTTLEVHTKCHPNLPLEESVTLSKQSLGRDTLDILYIHDRLNSGKWPKSKIRSLAKHLDNGVGAIGASIYEMEEFLMVMDIPEVSVLQVPMNILDRRFADPLLLNEAIARGKKVFARSVFLQGLLVAELSEIPAALSPLKAYISSFQTVARNSGRSPVSLALAFVKQFDQLSGVIVGARTCSELEGVMAEYSQLGDSTVTHLAQKIDEAPWSFVDPRRWSRP